MLTGRSLGRRRQPIGARGPRRAGALRPRHLGPWGRDRPPGDRRVPRRVLARRPRRVRLRLERLGDRADARRRRRIDAPSTRPRSSAIGRRPSRRCSSRRAAACARSSCGPGLVYGGDSGVVSDMLRDACNGIVRVVGSGDNHWPLIYRDDLADLFVRLIAHADIAGVVHATDGSDDTVNDLVEAMSSHVTHKPEVRHMSIADARHRMGALAEALAMDQIVRSPKALGIGWAPSLTSASRNVPAAARGAPRPGDGRRVASSKRSCARARYWRRRRLDVHYPPLRAGRPCDRRPRRPRRRPGGRRSPRPRRDDAGRARAGRAAAAARHRRRRAAQPAGPRNPALPAPEESAKAAIETRPGTASGRK